MCYVEVHDWPAVRGRLLEANARYTPRGADPATDPDGGWVHPKELHGLLLGISRTGARLGLVGPQRAACRRP